ncbi:DUF6024 family protein [Paraburkholderia sp. ZP32-5]|uniref:DUF6024 family protein n=1 Tax=Paraburkholderia sp. ZP32-5 TaxID=2883245 RepID=UPI001F40A778|nr:DUF6024 family protein [Paraburkholderia sp. ZP32-5]
MDSASIAPIFHTDSNRNFFRHAKQLRDELRGRLVEIYRLQDFSIYFVPSVRYGLLALKHWLESAGWQVGLRGGSHYAPIAELFPQPIFRQYDGPDAWISTHVGPYDGAAYRLSAPGALLEIVDASHSFATNLHAGLIEVADVFVAPLHKHAALTVGLALIAVRRELATMPVPGMLEEIEGTTASQAPLIEALNNLECSGVCAFNKAAIGDVRADLAETSIVCISDFQSPLPFACFRHQAFSHLARPALRQAGATYFPAFDVLRIARWARGPIDGDPIEFTADIRATLVRLSRQ